MGSPLENPLYRYGVGISSAAILAFVAFSFLEGTARWLVLALAVVEITVVPQVLKKVGEQAEA